MTSLKRACRLLLALALVLGLQAVAYAQTGAASITGLVTDQSGAATPGATVTPTHQDTNAEYNAVASAMPNGSATTVATIAMRSESRIAVHSSVVRSSTRHQCFVIPAERAQRASV